MRGYWGIGVACLLGLAVGIGSALVILRNGELLADFEKDGWIGNSLAGSPAADPYTRGFVASVGLLALNKSETIYFHRYRDEAGRPLREECEYEIRGGRLPARWWSVTIYAADNFLPLNQDQALSIDATRIAVQDDGSWTATISKGLPADGQWLSSRSAGNFSLSLRMYNPEAQARDKPAIIGFPRIVTTS